MTTARNPPTRTWIARGFTTVEDIVYLGLAVVLAGSAVGLLVTGFIDAVRTTLAGRLDGDIIALLDRLLLVLLVVELLYTVQVSFREHALVPEPFLLVGLIAVIRRILVVTAEVGRASASGAPVSHFIWELAVLAALVIALTLSLALLRKWGSAAAARG
jgi:uncharacterized membrane protein (DUF373 family)